MTFRSLGTGTGKDDSIPKAQEREGKEKNRSHNKGTLIPGNSHSPLDIFERKFYSFTKQNRALYLVKPFKEN